jgi:hypothetical protein
MTFMVCDCRAWLQLGPLSGSGLTIHLNIVNETEEWFYQLQGSMLLRIVENEKFRDVEIKEGEMFLLPGGFQTYEEFPRLLQKPRFPLYSYVMN